MRLHLDTDFAGDTDDACALAMILGWPDVDVVGITTTADPDGRRAGYVDYFLGLAERAGIPVAAGGGRSLTTGGPMGVIPDHDTFWGCEVGARPSPADAAVDLLDASIEAGATIAAIGPYTNLALLEAARPGRLADAVVVAMGGWIDPPAPGLPPWGPNMDWNVQCDTDAAVTVVAAAGALTLVTLPVTLKSHLRAAHMSRLVAAGPVGELLARQAVAHEAAFAMSAAGRAHAALPDDLLNFQYDPVACAVALGWSGATIERVGLKPVIEETVLRFERDEGGRAVNVVADIDADDFEETWLSAVERVGRRGG
jgi:purine nucleosidase